MFKFNKGLVQRFVAMLNGLPVEGGQTQRSGGLYNCPACHDLGQWVWRTHDFLSRERVNGGLFFRTIGQSLFSLGGDELEEFLQCVEQKNFGEAQKLIRHGSANCCELWDFVYVLCETLVEQSIDHSAAATQREEESHAKP